MLFQSLFILHLWVIQPLFQLISLENKKWEIGRRFEDGYQMEERWKLKEVTDELTALKEKVSLQIQMQEHKSTRL